jgi:hypothetical protein
MDFFSTIPRGGNMTLRWIARDFQERHNFRGIAELAMPVFVRRCRRHDRWEWYDIVSRVGGVAGDLKSLQEQLKRRFSCRQCELYHVDEVAIVVAEDFSRRAYRLRRIWFGDFLKLTNEDLVDLIAEGVSEQ